MGKRSKGVTFWAWFFIVTSLLGLLGMIDAQQQIRDFGVVFFLSGLLSIGAYLICGMYLLKLKEPARKAVIILGLINILLMPYFLMKIGKAANFDDYSAKKKQMILQTVKPEYQQAALENIGKENEAGKKVIFWGIMIVLGLPFLALEIIPMYFFTRPKVKEQFN
jgi:xanthosine utilization system XapX-like protein